MDSKVEFYRKQARAYVKSNEEILEMQFINEAKKVVENHLKTMKVFPPNCKTHDKTAINKGITSAFKKWFDIIREKYRETKNNKDNASYIHKKYKQDCSLLKLSRSVKYLTDYNDDPEMQKILYQLNKQTQKRVMEISVR